MLEGSQSFQTSMQTFVGPIVAFYISFDPYHM